MAYCDTVTDALTVQAAKMGGDDVNENLNSFSYAMQAIGAISGALMAKKANTIGPFKCFAIYMVLQILFFGFTLLIDKKMEPEELDELVPQENQPR